MKRFQAVHGRIFASEKKSRAMDDYHELGPEHTEALAELSRQYGSALSPAFDAGLERARKYVKGALTWEMMKREVRERDVEGEIAYFKKQQEELRNVLYFLTYRRNWTLPDVKTKASYERTLARVNGKLERLATHAPSTTAEGQPTRPGVSQLQQDKKGEAAEELTELRKGKKDETADADPKLLGWTRSRYSLQILFRRLVENKLIEELDETGIEGLIAGHFTWRALPNEAETGALIRTPIRWAQSEKELVYLLDRLYSKGLFGGQLNHWARFAEHFTKLDDSPYKPKQLRTVAGKIRRHGSQFSTRLVIEAIVEEVVSAWPPAD